MKSLIAEGRSDEAWEVHMRRKEHALMSSRTLSSSPASIPFQAHFRSLISSAMNATGCSYIYDLTQCQTDPEEENYEVYAMYDSTRAAVHVGNREDNYRSSRPV